MTHPTAVVVVAGLDATDQAVAAMGIQCDLPAAAVVRLTVDADAGQVRWTVSDITGVVEQDAQEVRHPCLSCAMREAILPTLVRLAESGRWRTLVVSLPPAAEPLPMVLGVTSAHLDDGRPVAQHLDLRSTVAVISTRDVCSAVFDDILLAEIGLALVDDDRRSLGEAVVAQVELADAIVSAHALDASDTALLDHLRRPGSTVAAGLSALDARALLACRTTADEARAAVDPRRRSATGAPAAGGLDTVVLESWRPFHPTRLLDRLEALASGDQRGRGAFWLPGRPDTAVAWEASGGQLSIGGIGDWSGVVRASRLVVTGDDETIAVVSLAFHEALMTEAEMLTARDRWTGRPDGFEPWIGDDDASDVA